ncbi:MAG TPA: hypothetical protein ENK57_13640 [Polyangiaceae bacterium]|nr:hypothetical protein [Polyangiaceae bacterium]
MASFADEFEDELTIIQLRGDVFEQHDPPALPFPLVRRKPSRLEVLITGSWAALSARFLQN